MARTGKFEGCVLYCFPPAAPTCAMPIQLRPLSSPPAAFTPHLAAEAVERHRQAQQAGLDALNALLGERADAEPPPALAALAVEARGAVAAHAAQAWSEEFHWAALRPPREGDADGPAGALAQAIDRDFGDIGRMRERFAEAAGRLPGPGWAWLARRRDGRLAILATPRSATPLAGSDTPLLACCLWPHAYAHEAAGGLERHLAAFWTLVDWDVVGARLKQASGERLRPESGKSAPLARE